MCFTVQAAWNVFISAVFYIGKGTRSRPFSHLYEAVKKFDRNTMVGSYYQILIGTFQVFAYF